MKALIVSDNHGIDRDLYELMTIYEHDIDLWLHCGDSEFRLNDPVFDVFQAVLGNTDFDHFPPQEVNELAGRKIVHVHGHQHSVSFGVEGLNRLAEKENADIVFYGHTHIAKVDFMNGRYFINPGSINFPRGTLREGSYAILTLDDTPSISFFTNDHEIIEDLSQPLNLLGGKNR